MAEKARRWVEGPGVICYLEPAATKVDQVEYTSRRDSLLSRGASQTIEVPARHARLWELRQGDLCRISVPSGSQVGDLNLWNLSDPEEHFFSAKTRQLHATHLTTWDRLWSNRVRPMATIVEDTLSMYGLDPEGAGVHDVIGSRCDPYTLRLLGGEEGARTCHGNLVEVIATRGLPERLVHDVWNIFMCTGFNKQGRYFVKPSPARTGDRVEIIADMDLLLALSACPHGDVSMAVGEAVPPEKCHPLLVEVFKS